ncbi:MAG: DUF2817 domain-containing protein [Luminiphilus sp.]
MSIDNLHAHADWHSKDAHEASLRFREVCSVVANQQARYEHDLSSPNGDEIAVDTAYFGSETASKLLVVVSGIHGLEALAGSAIQIGWVASGGPASLPEDLAVLMVHQINPWGCAWRRRFNEDNVDLNRNFLDFNRSVPSNSKYAGIHDILKPETAMGTFGEASAQYLAGLVAERGIEDTIDLLMGGQHEYPDGFGFGGQEPSWSRRTFEHVLAPFRDQVEQVCYLELHSGLGPYGYGQIISLQHGDVLARTRDWFGQWVFNPRADRKPGEPGYREVAGHSTDGFSSLFAGAEVTPVTLEMGTYPPFESLALLLEEHILFQAGDAAPAGKLEAVRERLEEYHCPADLHWRDANWLRGYQVIKQAIDGLSSEPR